MQQLVVSVTNSWELFADHSVLTAVLKFPSNGLREAYWFRPIPIHFTDQEEISALQQSQCRPIPRGTSTEEYASIFQEYERVVTEVKQLRGKAGLFPAQQGRGKTTDRSFRLTKVAPITPARPGEEVQTFEGLNLQHKRWYTQLRRLVSYVNHVRHDRVEATAVDHKHKLWSAIWFAPGFQKGFARRWNTRATKMPNSPEWIPKSAPKFPLAQQVLQHFRVEFQECEAILQQQRQERTKDRYAKDVNRIFRDVRKPSPVPVQVLVAHQATQVLEVVSPTQVKVDREVNIEQTQSWTSPVGQQVVASASDSTLTFQHPHQLAPGDSLVQEALIGSVDEIHRHFAAEWTRRWDRHLHLSTEHWQEINSFIDLALPKGDMPYRPITLDVWKATIAKKRTRAAPGLDGITRADLQTLPDSLHVEIIRLLHKAEASGEWPEQAMHGAIHALAKKPEAATVTEYRPVTVLPLIYRCWATIRAKEMLAFIATIAPPEMMGNLPGRSSPQVWYSLQAMIERSLYEDGSQNGMVTDLVAAFNGLPREPIFRAAVQIGVSSQVVRAWAAAVTGVTRHFFVRGQPGPGLKSSTGFPEGCPLSVCAMCLCNLILHSYMSCRCPRITMFTYVDNVEVLATAAEDAMEGVQVLSRLTEFLGVPIDPNKTYAWALNAESRRKLRQAEQEVKYQHKDLGAHLQYCARQTNGAVKEKCKSLHTLWPSLCQSRAPLAHKARALTTVAWPRAFHGASTVHLSDAILKDLRAGAMKGLNLDKAGASPLLQFSLTQNTMQDPGFFVLWNALIQFRRFGTEMDVATLDRAFWTPDRLKKPGPCGVLAARLTDIGWVYLQNFWFLDQDAQEINIMHSPIQELRERVKRAWQLQVGAEMAYRHGFSGLQNVDVRISTSPVEGFSTDEVGLIRALQNGTFMTHDHLYAAKLVDSPTCKFCGGEDSMEHRHWLCPFTEQFRTALPRTTADSVSQMPPCTRERGWMVEDPAVGEYKKELLNVPLVFQGPSYWQQHESSTLDLFTDGTCIAPTVPRARLAAWGVTQRYGHHEDGDFRMVSCGGLPGQWQTVLRAEIPAVIVAVQIGKAHGGNIHVWCDNKTVVRRFRQIQQGQFWPTPGHPDHDLWGTLKEALLGVEHLYAITKVKSHQTESVEDDVLTWVVKGNASADHAAATALAWMPPVVLAKQRAAEQACWKGKQVQQDLHKMYAKIGMF